jgi:hypothetical protein
MAAMSRLNFMEEQELAIRAIAQELAHLEHLVLQGELIAPENVPLFDGCIEQAVQLRTLIGKQNSNLPLPNWMQKTDRQAAALRKRHRSEIIKRA